MTSYYITSWQPITAQLPHTPSFSLTLPIKTRIHFASTLGAARVRLTVTLHLSLHKRATWANVYYTGGRGASIVCVVIVVVLLAFIFALRGVWGYWPLGLWALVVVMCWRHWLWMRMWEVGKGCGVDDVRELWVVLSVVEQWCVLVRNTLCHNNLVNIFSVSALRCNISFTSVNHVGHSMDT